MDVDRAIELVFKKCREKIVPNPKTRYKTSTGNLAFNAFKIEHLQGDVTHIYVDEAIAPYMVFTDKEWTSPKWHGRQNPNLGWFGKMAGYIANELAKKLHGEIR